MSQPTRALSSLNRSKIGFHHRLVGFPWGPSQFQHLLLELYESEVNRLVKRVLRRMFDRRKPHRLPRLLFEVFRFAVGGTLTSVELSPVRRQRSFRSNYHFL